MEKNDGKKRAKMIGRKGRNPARKIGTPQIYKRIYKKTQKSLIFNRISAFLPYQKMNTQILS
jgi:hypothetical protein